MNRQSQTSSLNFILQTTEMPMPQVLEKVGEHPPTPLQPLTPKLCMSALQPTPWLAAGTTQIGTSKSLSYQQQPF